MTELSRPPHERNPEQRAGQRLDSFCQLWLDDLAADNLRTELRQQNMPAEKIIQTLDQLERRLEKELDQDSLLRVHNDVAKERAGLAQATFRQRTWGMVKLHVYELSKVFGSFGQRGFGADLERQRHDLKSNPDYRKQLGQATLERQTKLAVLDAYFDRSPELRIVFNRFAAGEITRGELSTQPQFNAALPEIIALWVGEQRTLVLGDQTISADDPAMRGQLRALARNELIELAQLSKWEQETAAATESHPTDWRTKLKHGLTSAALWSAGTSLTLRWGARALLVTGAATGGLTLAASAAVGVVAGAGAGYVRERLKRKQREEERHWQMMAGEQLEGTATVPAERLIQQLRASRVELSNPRPTKAEIQAAVTLQSDINTRLETDTIAYGADNRIKVQHELMQLLGQFHHVIIRAAEKINLDDQTIEQWQSEATVMLKERLTAIQQRQERAIEQQERSLQLRGATYGSLIGGFIGGITPLAMDIISSWLSHRGVTLATNLTPERSVRFVAPTADGTAPVIDLKIADPTHVTVTSAGRTLGTVDVSAAGPLPASGVHAEVLPTGGDTTVVRLQDVALNRNLADVALQIKAETAASAAPMTLVEQLTHNTQMATLLQNMGIPKTALVLDHGILGIDETQLPTGSYLAEAGSWRIGRMENILRAWQLGQQPTEGPDLFIARAELAEWYKHNEHLGLDEAIAKAWDKPVAMVEKFQHSYEGPIKSSWNEFTETLGKTKPGLASTPPETTAPAETAIHTPPVDIKPPDAPVPVMPEPTITAPINVTTDGSLATEALAGATELAAAGVAGIVEPRPLSARPAERNKTEPSVDEALTTIIEPPTEVIERPRSLTPKPLSAPQRVTIPPPPPFRDNVRVERTGSMRRSERPEPPLEDPIQSLTAEQIVQHFPEIQRFDQAQESLILNDSNNSAISLAIPALGACTLDPSRSYMNIMNPGAPETTLYFSYGQSDRFLKIRRIGNYHNTDGLVTIEHNLNTASVERRPGVIISAPSQLETLIGAVLPVTEMATELVSTQAHETNSIVPEEPLGPASPPDKLGTADLAGDTDEMLTSVMDGGSPATDTLPGVSEPPIDPEMPTTTPGPTLTDPSEQLPTPEQIDRTAIKEVIERLSEASTMSLREFERTLTDNSIQPGYDASTTALVRSRVASSGQLLSTIEHLWAEVPLTDRAIHVSYNNPLTRRKERTTADKRRNFFLAEATRRIERSQEEIRAWYVASVQMLERDFAQATEKSLATQHGLMLPEEARQLYEGIGQLRLMAQKMPYPPKPNERGQFQKIIASTWEKLNMIFKDIDFLSRSRPGRTETPFAQAISESNVALSAQEQAYMQTPLTALPADIAPYASTVRGRYHGMRTVLAERQHGALTLTGVQDARIEGLYKAAVYDQEDKTNFYLGNKIVRLIQTLLHSKSWPDKLVIWQRLNADRLMQPTEDSRPVIQEREDRQIARQQQLNLLTTSGDYNLDRIVDIVLTLADRKITSLDQVRPIDAATKRNFIIESLRNTVTDAELSALEAITDLPTLSERYLAILREQDKL